MKKNNSKNVDKTRLNEKIRVERVRVIDENGEQIGVMETRKALSLAYSKELDLVEIAPQAKPPVCRILDYKKFVYQKERKARQSKKNQVRISVHEIKLSVNIADHDLLTKARQAQKFLLKGGHVKVSLRFKGREIVHPDLAFEVMNKFIGLTGEIAEIDMSPNLNGRVVMMQLVPNKSVLALAEKV